MSGKSIFANVTGFIGHYASEARATATALSMIVDNLALQPQDRAQIKAHIEGVLEGVERATDWLDQHGGNEPTPVAVSRADIDKAVKAVLADGSAFQSAIEAAVASRIDAAVAAAIGTDSDNVVTRDNVASIIDERLDTRLADGTAFHQSLLENDGTVNTNEADPAKDLSKLASGDKVKEASDLKTKNLVQENTKGK